MSVLDNVKEYKVEEVSKLKALGARTQFEEICRQLPPPRGFARAIAEKYARDEIAFIAEIKKASPSKGMIRADLFRCWPNSRS